MDLNKIGKLELGALIAGGVSLIVSFFPYYARASVDVPGAGSISSGTNAWDSWAVLGILLIIVATAAVAIKVFASENVPATVPLSLIAVATAGLGTLLLILRAFTYSGGFGVSVNPGWSGWLLFITTIVLTVLAALSFKDSGEKLPNFNAGGNQTPPPAN